MKSKNYPDIDHDIYLTQNDKGITIRTYNGSAIATIHVETIEDERVPTKNFWVVFKPIMKSDYDDSAAVIVEE